jgi:3-phenylpropionate/trans-cinnamate dioxygenase ferredoxin reductase component
MTDSLHDVVIVGGGLAAASAIETLRDEGYAGDLTLVGAEARRPYERPQLSKDVLKGAEFAELHDEGWYADREVSLALGLRATEVDPAARTVTVDDGRVLPYEALLLATGAVPRLPDLPGAEHAVTLRTADDALALKARLTPGTRVVLIGGGWIGLEVAAAAVEAAASAVVLERGDLPLRTVLGPELAGYLTDLHRSHGVDVRTGVSVAGIEPDGVRTTAGTVPADLVVAAIGAVPDTSLAEAAGLAVASPRDGGGIIVDAHLRTSDPQVYAAGDVALATHTTLGPLRVEHWDNAIRQGTLAARVMLGQEAVYDWQPYFFTDQFEFSMEYVGHGAPDDQVEIRGDRDAHEFIAYWLRDATVTAAMNVGIWDVNDRLRELVGQRVDPADLTDLR